MTRYVILGMGAAGMTAAETIRQYDAVGEIICVSAEAAGYYSRPGLAYYLSKELGEKSLYPYTRRDYQAQKFKVYHNTASQIDPQQQEVVFRDGKRLKYDRLLLALGAQAVRPQVEGLGLEGVVYLDSMSQTKHMIRKARWSKRAVVVGGGITALEIVEGLQARGVQVHFFLRGDRYWSRVLDSLESQIVLNRLRHEGVVIHTHTELERIVERRGKVAAVVTNDGRTLKTDLVAFAIGVRPRTSLAETSGLEVRRGIKIDAGMHTSAPNIFAAGDVAEVYEPERGEWLVDSLWYIARHQGMAAGLNMVGRQHSYRRKSPLNVTRLAGLTTTIIGQVGSGDDPEDLGAIVRGESETWQKYPDAVVCQNNFEVNRLRVMLGDRTILGAVLMGDQKISQPLEELVANQADIRPIHSQLTHPGADLGGILLRYWDQWRKTDAD